MKEVNRNVIEAVLKFKPDQKIADFGRRYVAMRWFEHNQQSLQG